MNLALFLLCGLAAAATIAVVVLVAVFDWAHASRAERLALGSIAGGMVWAAPSRFAAGGLTLGDLLLLAGVLALVLLTYGRRLARHVDQVERQAGNAPRLTVGWCGPDAIEPQLRAGRSRRR